MAELKTEKMGPPPPVDPFYPFPEPTSAEEVFKNVPPPSYEEIMGHQTLTSAKKDVSMEELPPLAYIDILPRCLYPGNMKGNVPPEYDRFSTLMEVANEWLRGNPSYGVWKCETVERRVESSGQVLMESMLFHEATYGFNVSINGIRLWLYARNGRTSPPQQLGLRTRVPDKMQVPIPLRGRNHFYCPTHVQTLTSYEGLKTTLEKFNRELISDPIGGSILNVECAVIKAAEGFERLEVDPDKTVFHETGGTLRRYTQVIRLFYVIGPPARETFDLIDVIPRYTQKPGYGKSAKLETYEETMSRLSRNRPSELKEGRVVNFQTLFPKYTDYRGELDVHSNETDDFVSGTLRRKQMQITRIFKVSGGSPKPLPETLSSKLFVPVRTGPRSFETMLQTMYRIEWWLRVTGLYVYNVETVPYLFHEHSRTGVDASKANIEAPVGVGKHFVTTIRLYFSQPYKEPSPALLPPVIPWRSHGSASCSIL